MQAALDEYDFWEDVAAAYRKIARTWPGRRNANPKQLCEAMIAAEDQLEFALARNQQKQAARNKLRELRRALETKLYP